MLCVRFQLWNEQFQWGIRTNFKQGQITKSAASSLLFCCLLSLSRKSALCVLALSLLHPSYVLVFPLVPSSAPLLSVPSSVCSSVIRSKGLRVGYSEACYGVWPPFSTQLLIYCYPAFHWVTDCMCVRSRVSVCACVCARLLPLYWMTSPICLDIGVRGHANPGSECEFPGYPEWPHPWKALQRFGGAYCAVTSKYARVLLTKQITVWKRMLGLWENMRWLWK